MSYFRPEIDAMAGYAPGEQPPPGKFLKLNTNENPYPPSETVVRAIQQAAQRGLERYPDPLGNAFRHRAAQLYGVEPDGILCGNGSDDILTIVTRAFVGQGLALRTTFPSYILYRSLAQLQGAVVEEIRFQPDWSLGDDFGTPNQRVRLAILTNPNSPSGTVVPIERVAELAEQLTCPLLVDEAYADFADSNCLDLVRRFPHVMIVRTLSKSYALAGLRFGYLIARPEMVAGLIKVKDSYNCDSLSIAAAVAALDDQTWLQATRAKILATRARLTTELKSLGFAAVESQANFVWAPHPRVPVRPIYERLKAQQVLVRYMDYPGWGDGLRVSVGTDEQIDAFLNLLGPLV